MHASINFRPTRILVIRRDNIGDLVCTTPLLSGLRHHFKEASVRCLVNSYNAGVLDGNPDVDQVYVYQKLKHVSGRFPAKIAAIWKRTKLIAKLRLWSPDLVVLGKSSYDRHGLRFARQIGAKCVIGFEGGAPDPQPDIRLSEVPDFRRIHEVICISEIAKALGVTAALGSLKIFPQAKLVSAYKGRLLPNQTPIFALHISARVESRRWGQANYETLIKSLLGKFPHSQVLLFWSPGDELNPFHPGDDRQAQLILQNIGSGRLVPMPTKEIAELVAGLSLADLVICSDGGALHIAAGLGKKVVGLFEFPVSELNHWYPWQVPYVICSGIDETIGSISQIAVQEAVSYLVEIKQ